MNTQAVIYDLLLKGFLTFFPWEEPKRLHSLPCFWGRLIPAFCLLLQQCLATSYLFTWERHWEDICAWINIFWMYQNLWEKIKHICEILFQTFPENIFFFSEETLKWQIHLHSPSQNKFFLRSFQQSFLRKGSYAYKGEGEKGMQVIAIKLIFFNMLTCYDSSLHYIIFLWAIPWKNVVILVMLFLWCTVEKNC